MRVAREESSFSILPVMNRLRVCANNWKLIMFKKSCKMLHYCWQPITRNKKEHFSPYLLKSGKTYIHKLQGCKDWLYLI